MACSVSFPVSSASSTSLLSSPALFSSKMFRLHKFVDKPTRNTIPFKSELRNGNRVARHSAASNENVKYFNFTPSLDGRWSKFTKYSIKFKIRREVLTLECNCNSLKICGALWDNYAYFLSNFKVSGHTSKPFKCKSTDTYIIPGENRAISSSWSGK